MFPLSSYILFWLTTQTALFLASSTTFRQTCAIENSSTLGNPPFAHHNGSVSSLFGFLQDCSGFEVISLLIWSLDPLHMFPKSSQSNPYAKIEPVLGCRNYLR